MTTTPRVLIVYQHLPHYRNGVFLQLQRDTTIEYEFAADTRSRDGSIPTIPTQSLRRFHRLTNRWRGPFLWQAGLLGLLRRRRYHAVVFLGDMAYLSTWAGAALCRLSGVRVLFWTIGWHRPDRGLRKLARAAFYRLAHGLALYGEVGRKLGREMGYPAKRMTVIGNSHSSCLNTDHASPRSELEELERRLPPPGTQIAAAVIRLNAMKRLDLLVRAAGVLVGRGRAVTVLLVGVGPERDRLVSLAADLGVELCLPGPVYFNDQLRLVYERTTVTVVPAYAGLTSIQSLAHGRPVITSDNEYHQAPESDSIRAGVTGGFYTDGSVESLADTIAHWLDRMRTDPATVATACQEEIRTRWSPEYHAAAIRSVVTGQLRAPSVTG